MSTKVVHCKREAYDVYIGRPSQWGNPFEIGRDGTREEVIAKYRAWIVQQPKLMAQVGDLYGKRLACWCAPKACHGDVLAELAAAAEQQRKLDRERILDQLVAEAQELGMGYE